MQRINRGMVKVLKGGCLLFCITILCAGCAEKASKAAKDGISDIEATQQKSEKETDRTKQEAERSVEKEVEQQIQTQPATPVLNGKTIVIDPGHSSVIPEGTEPVGPGSQDYKSADTIGTSGCVTGMPEYELTLVVAQKLQVELEKRGYKVLLTRQTSDAPLGCTQRAAVANQENAYAFIRIHANGSESSDAQGAMTICTTPANEFAPQLYTQSRKLSDCIITRMCEAVGCENDGVWETDTMSGNNWSQVPVTIVEMGYMTNPQEDQLMVQGEYQDKIVQGIANGVDDF